MIPKSYLIAIMGLLLLAAVLWLLIYQPPS